MDAPSLEPLPRDAQPLSIRRDSFARAYARHGIAGKAARIAGYSPKTADTQGNQLLRIPEVSAAIERYRRDQLENADVTVQQVLTELATIAFTDVTQVFDAEGELRPVHEWPKAVRRCVASFEVVIRNITAGDGHRDKVLRVRFVEKIEALKLLAQHLGMLIERREVGLPGEFAALSDMELADRIRVAASRLGGDAPVTFDVEPATPKRLTTGESGDSGRAKVAPVSLSPAHNRAPNEQTP